MGGVTRDHYRKFIATKRRIRDKDDALRDAIEQLEWAIDCYGKLMPRKCVANVRGTIDVCRKALDGD